MIRKPINDLTIRPKLSRTTVIAAMVCALLLSLACLYFAYLQGVKSGHEKFTKDQTLIEQLNDSLAESKQALAATQENLVFAQRQLQIQEEAYKQISKAYANSEQKNSVLGSRLDFYRSIISPEDGQSGPAIQAINYTFADGKLNFDITLVQAIKHKHQVRGSLTVTLFEQGEAVGQWPVSSSRSVSYQYFQQVSGSIDREKLNETAKLKVVLELQDGAALERWFDVAAPVTQPLAYRVSQRNSK